MTKCNVLVFFTGNTGGDGPPVQQTPQLVAHVDHHDLLAGAGQVGDLALDGLGNAGVDGAAETTVGGHADDQVLAALVLRGLDLGLLVEGCRDGATRGDRSVSPEKSFETKSGVAMTERKLETHPERRSRTLWPASAASQHGRTWQRPPSSWIW